MSSNGIVDSNGEGIVGRYHLVRLPEGLGISVVVSRKSVFNQIFGDFFATS